jgi:hypothetical protein
VERILFGDNQFFGVNHMSEEKARAQAMQFKDTASMMRVLDTAYDMGIKVFMCTTHDKVGEIVDIVKANPRRYAEFEFYPCMPYAHKYANSVGEVGLVETVRRFAVGSLMEMAVQGALLAVTQDLSRLMRLLVDAEMKRFAGVKTPYIFIQNVVTDLLLGMGFEEIFPAFDKHVRERYGAEPAYITMNLPRLVDTLERVGIRKPIVCANINKIGFRMSGGVDLYKEVIRSGRCRTIAMSVLASGAIPAREAFEWACGIEGLESIVFGASSASNIRQSKELIERAWNFKLKPPAANAEAAVAP